jgi:hypothetical protein
MACGKKHAGWHPTTRLNTKDGFREQARASAGVRVSSTIHESIGHDALEPTDANRSNLY